MLRRLLGDRAEDRALRYLRREGWTLVARNWRVREGELDLVMSKGDTLAMIEVRARSRNDFGGALASVDRHKQARIVRAARAFLAAHPQFRHHAVRFDVVAIEGSEAPQWIPNAFDAGE